MSIAITGLVTRAVSIPEDLAQAQRTRRVEDFVCLEGWSRPDQAWSGYRLDDLIRLANPVADGRFVEIGAAEFVTVLALDDLRETPVLLADTLNGKLLTQATGGPWRLVVPGGVCYQSVKGVERIVVVDHRRGDTARTIAFKRIGRSDFNFGAI